MRSHGITPQDLVKQAYYIQEGVLLDFWPTDDKYKEMLYEANLQKDRLQEIEDWSWLRKSVILGHCGGHGEIPEFQMPPDMYKPAQGHKDAVRLYRVHCGGCHHRSCCDCQNATNALHGQPIQAHWMSQSSVNNTAEDLQGFVYAQVPNRDLKATYTASGIITFNRPLNHIERSCIAVTDMIMRIPDLHICDDTCPNAGDIDNDPEKPTPCPHIEKKVFEMIPDINYMVYAMAAGHGVYSPPAALAVQSAQEKMKEILSSMRQNDAMKTTPDIIKRDHQTFFTVV